MVRSVGLHDHLAFEFPPPCPSRDLGQELEGSFAGAKIGDVKSHVSIKDSDESHIREMEAFRDHLCSEKDIDLFGTESVQGIAQLILFPHRIGVDSGNSGIREDLV